MQRPRLAIGITLIIVSIVSGGLLRGAEQATAGPSSKPDAAVLINVNTATPAELELLPGIGPKIAGRIVEHRSKNGPFTKIEEIMNVRGIGEKTFLKLRKLITVATPDGVRVGSTR